MRIFSITIIFLSINLTSISQVDSIRYRIYDFINSTDLIETKGDTYLKENGSPENLLNSYDSLDFEYKHCMFIDGGYYFDTVFWAMNLNQEDKDFIIAQIRELKHFKWEKDKISKNVKLISKKESKKYSRKAMKFWKGNLDSSEFSRKTLTRYSAPVFNKKHNLALVYSYFYSGPLSASWGIDIFILKDGKWIYIGHDPKGIS